MKEAWPLPHKPVRLAPAGSAWGARLNVPQHSYCPFPSVLLGYTSTCSDRSGRYGASLGLQLGVPPPATSHCHGEQSARRASKKEQGILSAPHPSTVPIVGVKHPLEGQQEATWRNRNPSSSTENSHGGDTQYLVAGQPLVGCLT